ncbi:piggyBac transposable element-derived protein 4-like isoform X1 [Xyrauchen texanus]|uniref:piggyBac transposable element-derived protein 4-like isoform X1 n=1 Tax=Xyrauchen texanus TaxID=154827 RepID=UPI0022424FC5|nr:piggyBac transposable element-derived protein 4-like isoform X1 [Xyrauchen texanus]
MFIMSAQVDVIHADEQQMLQTPVKIEVKQEEIKEENTTEEHQSGEVVPAELMEVKEECEELNEVKDEKQDFISGEKCLSVSNTKKNLSPRRPRRSAAKKSFTCSRCGMCFTSNSSLKQHQVSTSDSITSQHVCLDSDEEFTISSDEEWDPNDELFHFEEGLDPAEDTIADDDENDSDQTPVAKRAKKAKTRKKQSTLSWKTETDIDTVPQTLKFLPAREPGPQLSPADAHTPLSLFKMFFSENAVSTLCHNTNAQAARAIAKGRKYKWVDVSVSEMYCYFGLLFYMAMVKVSSIRDYWRPDSVFSVTFPATIMSRERYRTISWNLHMSHPDADKENDRKRGTAEHDHLFRVKPLMDTIRHACKAIYHPKRNLAVDEKMVECKSYRKMTPSMKAKPSRWGFKLFALTDSSNGYTVDFSVYTGKNNFPTGHGISYDAVTSLLDCKVLGSGYHVYMDRFLHKSKAPERLVCHEVWCLWDLQRL